MHKIIKVLLGTLFFCFLASNTFAQDKEITSILKKIDDVQEDIKTLEKAVYSENNQSASTSFNNEDVLTKHLLKLLEAKKKGYQLFDVPNNKRGERFVQDSACSRGFR